MLSANIAELFFSSLAIASYVSLSTTKGVYASYLQGDQRSSSPLEFGTVLIDQHSVCTCQMYSRMRELCKSS